ncbi:28S ribosomal protein S27, mitochondrial [Patella vulgata]|uniref:28S ribosomal protein S27, mitochondrial n=1 Tax=Patella vulgata TaxID=6465 RepID=UPI0024A7F8F4|nr:28S ribosomal protein S27, mitochondrial [Patella vulgata]
MAASVWKTCCSTLKHVKLSTKGVSFSARRYLLSEAYSCQDAWKQRLESSTLQQGSLNEFAVQLRERFEKEKKASVVDVDILANRLHEMEVTNAEFMEEILHRFRRSVDSVPVNDSIVYAVVRAYIDLGLTDRLILLMKDKWNYGIFPNNHGVCFLLDHLIKENKYQDAAQVAYEMMLQEDFSHPVTYLLSLYGCSQHYTSISLDPQEEKQVDPDEEEDWIPVKYIRFPVYDDHFDIKDERFLMGKTLYILGKTCQDEVLGRSLQFMGLGMYQKFEKAIKLLENWEKDQPGILLLKEAVVKFEESLVKAETRPDEEPEIDMGLRSIDDEIKLLRLTADEKDNFIQQLNVGFIKCTAI